MSFVYIDVKNVTKNNKSSQGSHFTGWGKQVHPSHGGGHGQVVTGTGSTSRVGAIGGWCCDCVCTQVRPPWRCLRHVVPSPWTRLVLSLVSPTQITHICPRASSAFWWTRELWGWSSCSRFHLYPDHVPVFVRTPLMAKATSSCSLWALRVLSLSRRSPAPGSLGQFLQQPKGWVSLPYHQRLCHFFPCGSSLLFLAFYQFEKFYLSLFGRT